MRSGQGKVNIHSTFTIQYHLTLVRLVSEVENFPYFQMVRHLGDQGVGREVATAAKDVRFKARTSNEAMQPL